MAKTTTTAPKGKTRSPQTTTPPARPAGRAPAGAGAAGNGQLNSLFAKQLKAAEARWNAAKEASSQPGWDGGLPDGKYIGNITNLEIKATQNDSDKIGLLVEITVTEGTETGSKGYIWSNMMDTSPDDEMLANREMTAEELNDDYMIRTQRLLRKLGLDVDGMSFKEITSALEELLASAPTVRFTVKTSKGKDKDGEARDYTNTYIDKLIGLGAGGEAPEGEEAGEGEGEGEGEEAGEEGEDAGEGEGEEAAEEGDTIAAGQKVVYTDANGKQAKGIVKSIKGANAQIVNEKTKKVDVAAVEDCIALG